jgi:ABC-type transporter Mla MlaB component
MNLSLLPLNSDIVFRIGLSGPVSLRGSVKGHDPLVSLLGPNCYAHKILLKLEGSQFIDTSGVVWLSRTHNAFVKAGGTLVLYAVPPTVSDLLDFLRITPLLNVAGDEAEAHDLLRDLAESAAQEREDAEAEGPVIHLRAV